jgi:lysozyme family protein
VLQRVCGLSDDGRLTDAVIAAVAVRKAADLIDRLCDERLAFLQRLKTWPAFGAGWRRRVAEVRAAALQMAAAGPSSSVAPKSAPVPAPAPGKGVVPLAGGAQKGTTSAIVAAGAAAAHQAHRSGVRPVVVIAIAAMTAALALAAWFAWHARQKRRQDMPVAITSIPQPPVN